MTKDRIFLIVAAFGLFPIALAYGLVPDVSMPLLYGVEVESVSVSHILRAVMGLYLAMVAFWLAGAAMPALRVPALYSVLVFMGGLAAGRLLSLVVDGMPSPLLVLYLILEVGFALVAVILLRGSEK